MPKGKLMRLLRAKMIHSARARFSKPPRRRVRDVARVLMPSRMGTFCCREDFRYRCIGRGSLPLISPLALAIVSHTRPKIVNAIVTNRRATGLRAGLILFAPALPRGSQA